MFITLRRKPQKNHMQNVSGTYAAGFILQNHGQVDQKEVCPQMWGDDCKEWGQSENRVTHL